MYIIYFYINGIRITTSKTYFIALRVPKILLFTIVLFIYGENSFSKRKRIESYLQSSMKKKNNNSSTIISVENDILG